MYNIDDLFEKLMELGDKFVDKATKLGDKFPFNYALEKLDQFCEQLSQDFAQDITESELYYEEYERKIAPIRERNNKELEDYHKFLFSKQSKKKIYRKGKN